MRRSGTRRPTVRRRPSTRAPARCSRAFRCVVGRADTVSSVQLMRTAETNLSWAVLRVLRVASQHAAEKAMFH